MLFKNFKLNWILFTINKKKMIQLKEKRNKSEKIYLNQYYHFLRII